MITDSCFLEIANIVGKNSKAKRSKVGAILVKDGNIIAIGYNGTPSKFTNICETKKNGMLITKPEVLHAESNAIAKCASSVNSSKNSVLYLTLSPCFECCKLIIQAGIKRVVFSNFYRDKSGLNLLTKGKIKWQKK